ncbi:10472_t:CDS:10, partial [Acaulospora colombiana]
LRDFFDTLEKRLSDVNNDACWGLIKEISVSSDFIDFLRKIADEDLKNLINGVDDSEGRLVQEDTVSSLIQVKQILVPLINIADDYTLDGFLRQFNHVAKSNTQLSSKITLCNSNNMALQNMYNNISNRGEVAKEKIKNSVMIGTYTFRWSSDDHECSATLTYPSKDGTMTINLSELQDLRGRALLIAKPIVDIGPTEDDERESFERIVGEFVSQVDTVLEIVKLSSELIEKGHFSYRESNTPLRGTESMKQHLTKLKDELTAWGSAVDSAQNQFYYLTFFPARHILLFYDYFSTSSSTPGKENLCQKLVKYVNPSAHLQSNRKIISKNKYFKLLCDIGDKLKLILSKLPKEPDPLDVNGERVVSDIVNSGKLFVAACNDKFLIPNVIMSLQLNQGVCPNPWQLLFCNSATTSEEISIFIKRCFLAAKNGYQDRLFCMANLEELEYKLQYELVKKIRSYMVKPGEYHLALICCPEEGMHHHILDQFSDFQHTNGLSVETMKNIYRIICPDVICVTSELSGQGKTEWIRQESFRRHKIPQSFLISDGDDFGRLVRRLSKFKLRQEVDSFHINLISADNPGEINMFLFQVLTFGFVSYQGVIATLPQIPIFVEVASSADQRLMKSIKFLSCLDTVRLSVKINKLITSHEINSQIQLLSKYFFDVVTPDLASFRFLEIFINVFADQLVRLSSSSFFQVENLKLMVGENDIRTTLFKTLMDVSKDFATRSTRANWKILSVPENVKRLLESQHVTSRVEDARQWRLDDYREMSTDALLSRLENLARQTTHSIDYPPYALSADNLLKMALILLRTRANVPVVVCGEAGCGKTSLISFLATVMEVEFHALNLHAGITEEIIFRFMSDSLVHADERDIWLFFDEINTCNHIGLLADLIAHRVYLGKPLSPHVRVFAACNPYRIRTKSVSDAGLQRTKKDTDANLQLTEYEFHRSNLVYEVKPLPDQILDYVWDYGILHEDDEKKYIEIMVEAQLKEDGLYHRVVAELLSRSQKFIRKVEEQYSVSLRDVKRIITLIKFFHKSLQNRPPISKKSPKYPPSKPPIFIRSCILALGLGYQSRLYLQDLRSKYREEMCEVFQQAGMNISAEQFNKVIRLEQENYIDRMQLPPNTAKNDALLENVLVMTVSSKSLAIRLVSQNLRGSDSNDKYFKTFPQVYLIPHQGSSSSTSDGILKVFDKAYNYQKTSSEEFPVISVVLLDEVGLAETSPFNPLKVLHSLLEPSYPAEGPTVSVVGISNWRLDNSKSSRALLVQRPKLGQEDLIDIAVRLLDKGTEQIPRSSLAPLAKAYSEYEREGQELPNFHGLRDYYALVKSLSLVDLTPEHIQVALARNFGGTGKQQELCEEYFGEVIALFNRNQSWAYNAVPIDYLINANLEDSSARHLMVIGKSESIVNLLTYQLREKGLDPVIIFGSQFPNDRDDYSYTILSRIMMCVEAGRPLILTDLEIIYGSLYDLWNQNYIVAGSKEDPKYYTRVALGAYANPMLSVARNFRCILVMDEDKLPNADPPLLNRFEKQRMTMADVLRPIERELVDQLVDWVKQMSTYPEMGNFIPSHKKFTHDDLFVGFDQEETIQSLVIYGKKSYPDLDDDEVLERCKEILIWIATSDGIIRAEKSSMPVEEVERWKDVYFRSQKHDNLFEYFSDLLQKSEFGSNGRGHQIIINTFSNINTDIKKCLEEIAKCMVIKLSTFKTEADFQSEVRRFWFRSPAKNLLVLQCDITTANAGCIKLAKFIIEQLRHEYYQQNDDDPIVKHACIVLHMHRDLNASFKGFNFMCGWDQVTIEILTKQERPLSSLLYGDLGEIIETIYPFEEILDQELLWCLSCIKYPSTAKSLEHVRNLNVKIRQSHNFVNLLKERTVDWLKDTVTLTDWQYNVASNKKSLYPYSSFAVALSAHIRTLVRQPIAKLLCALERLSALTTFLTLDEPHRMEIEQNEQLLRFWRQMFMNKSVVSIEDLPEPKPDGYLLTSGVYKLNFPFSYYFIRQIDGFKRVYDEEVAKLREDSDHVDRDSGRLYEFVLEDYEKSFSENLSVSMQNFKSSPIELNRRLYFDDFVTVNCPIEGGRQYTSILSYILRKSLGPDKTLNPCLLHIYWWNNAGTVLTEFQLAKMCSSIKNVESRDDDLRGMDLADYLVTEACQELIDEFCESQDDRYFEWQDKATKVLSLCERVPRSSTVPSLNLLRISSGLISTRSISQRMIKEIIKLGSDGGITIDFIDVVLNFLQDDHYQRRLFINQCLDITPIESVIRQQIYERLFLDEPFPFASITVLRIFELEDAENRDIFFRLLEDTSVLQRSPRLSIIDKCLKEQGLNSKMASLCCDVIQKTFFAKDLTTLWNYFGHAIDKITRNLDALLRLTSIAFLKEFVHQFWNYINPNNIVNEPIDINSVNNNHHDLFTLITEINGCMVAAYEYPLIHSLKIYFLRDLRMREFSMDDVRQFCQNQEHTLPWISHISWNDDQESKLPFDPYRPLGDAYSILEKSYLPLLNINNRLPFNSDFFNNFKKGGKTYHIALIGMIFSRLHALRASREWSQAETQAAEYLLEKVNGVSQLSPVYKRTVEKIVKNEHRFMRIGADISTRDLLIKSVIGHVIALHASIPAESSPLAQLLQNMHYCTGSYILTCPSDIEALILSAIAEPGQTKLDERPKIGVKSKDQTGYIGETINNGKNESPHALSFLRKNNEIATDTETYCMGHIQNDWVVLREILNISDEDLALLLHSILNLLTEQPPKPLTSKNPAERQEWEEIFSKQYVAPQVKSVAETAINFRLLIDNASENSKGSDNPIEGEIHQTMLMDKNYRGRYLPNLWRAIGETNLQSLRAQYFGDEKNVENFPFLSVFFNHSENLELIKHLYPIVKFVTMISSRLEYRLSREESERQTFRDFITNQSEDDEYGTSNVLDLAFNDFARSWNEVIGKVKNYQCHELPEEKPTIGYDSPIVFALVEPKDSGVYVCAIIEYLIGLQNDFLQEVVALPLETPSLKFMGETRFISETQANASTSSSTQIAPPTQQRYVKSIQLIHAKPENLIDYKWDDQLLRHSQRNFDVGRGHEIFYEFQKIEELLAFQLLSDKAHIITLSDSQMFIEPFHFHMELFKGYMRIISEIKNLIPQRSISEDKVSDIMCLTSNSSFSSRQYSVDSLSFDNASELLSCLEILLCFAKRTGIGNGQVLISKYVNQWMKLTTLLENNLFKNLLKAELMLENVVALYELVEEQVANGVVNYIDDKYKEDLTDDLRDEITKAVDYSKTDSKNLTKIPADVFASALKRFILRFLSTESIKEEYPLSVYFTDATLNLWPSFIPETLVDDHFPESLLVCHAYSSYKFIDDKLEDLKKQQQSTSDLQMGGRNRKELSSQRGRENRGEPRNRRGDASSSRGRQSARGKGSRQKISQNRKFDAM